MLSARRACAASAAARGALISGRNASAAATARSGGGASCRQQLLLTHRSLRTSSSPCFLSRGSRGRLAKTAARRRQQASTLCGDKLAPPPTTAGGKVATASSENNAVAGWLFGTAGAVAVMVTVGGITRMTKSGLSMTDWKVQGSLPPSSEVFARANGYCVYIAATAVE